MKIKTPDSIFGVPIEGAMQRVLKEDKVRRRAKRRVIMTDCEELKASSQYVRYWLRKQSDVKEESLTDWLLFNVSERIPRITYKAFSRHEEARKTGADWEWWFLFRHFHLRCEFKPRN